MKITCVRFDELVFGFDALSVSDDVFVIYVIDEIGVNYMEDDFYLDEEWVQLPQYPDYYVSDFGRVYDSKRYRVLRVYLSTKGYLQVNIETEKGWKVLFVHRLVGFCFVPGYFEGAEINHKDGDKHYNVPENLEWATHLENIRHARDTGLYGKKQ